MYSRFCIQMNEGGNEEKGEWMNGNVNRRDERDERG